MTWFVLLSKHNDGCDWLPISGSCLLLDRKPSTTSKWGRFPADAKCHHQVFPANQTCDNGTQLLIQAGWRLSPPFCQYLHIQAVHPPLLQVHFSIEVIICGIVFDQYLSHNLSASKYWRPSFWWQSRRRTLDLCDYLSMKNFHPVKHFHPGLSLLMDCS